MQRTVPDSGSLKLRAHKSLPSTSQEPNLGQIMTSVPQVASSVKGYDGHVEFANHENRPR